MAVLSYYGDKWGDNIYPSQREIAFRAAVSVKTVNAHMQRAAKEGWLKRKQMGKGQWGRGFKHHCYELTVPGYVANLRVRKLQFWLPPFEFELLKKTEQVVTRRRYKQEG